MGRAAVGAVLAAVAGMAAVAGLAVLAGCTSAGGRGAAPARVLSRTSESCLHLAALADRLPHEG